MRHFRHKFVEVCHRLIDVDYMRPVSLLHFCTSWTAADRSDWIEMRSLCKYEFSVVYRKQESRSEPTVVGNSSSISDALLVVGIPSSFSVSGGKLSWISKSDNWKVHLKFGSTSSASCLRSEAEISSNSAKISSSTHSPGRRRPLVKPGGTVLSPLCPSCFCSFPRSARASSSPPGQNGTYPDFPLTKLLLGAGARSNEVDVRPLDERVLEVYERTISDV